MHTVQPVHPGGLAAPCTPRHYISWGQLLDLLDTCQLDTPMADTCALSHYSLTRHCCTRSKSHQVCNTKLCALRGEDSPASLPVSGKPPLHAGLAGWKSSAS
jgi:hypothetical protein